MGATLGDIDLVDPDNYVERVPFEWFDHLRLEHPVIWHDEPSPNHGFWAVTRYDDLTQVHMDWQTFSSEVGAVSLEELDQVADLALGCAAHPGLCAGGCPGSVSAGQGW